MSKALLLVKREAGSNPARSRHCDMGTVSRQPKSQETCLIGNAHDILRGKGVLLIRNSFP